MLQVPLQSPRFSPLWKIQCVGLLGKKEKQGKITFFFFFKVFNTIIKFHLFLKKEVQIATS